MLSRQFSLTFTQVSRYTYDLCQMEESGLHNHIDPSAETDFLRDFKSINDVKFRMVKIAMTESWM